MTGARPNVLLVTLDQIRADAIFGPLGRCVALPTFARLAESGVVFDSHFGVTSPCGPARASLLTGLYAMNHRVIRNGAPLSSRFTNIALEARRAGYEPLLFGYTDVQADPSERPPADPDLHSYEGVLPGFRELAELRFDAPLEWPASLVAKGYTLPPHWFDLWRPVSADGGAPKLRDPALYRAEDSDTAFLTDRALHALDMRRGKPWFAHLTYIRPHPPLVAPAPYNTLVDPAMPPPPVGGRPDHPFLKAWFSDTCQKGLFVGFDGDFAAMSAATTVELRALYLGLLAEVDRQFGRILDWLDETGQSGRTLVVVTGDHGEMLGDHGLWGKDSPFDPVFHVPLLVRHPDFGSRAGTHVQAITESVDIAPTILEAIGAPVPPEMDGASLSALLGGDDRGWRDAAFAEIDLSSPGEPSRFQRSLGLGLAEANAAVLRETRWKLVHFNGGVPPMLFDLDADPDETRDLGADPAHAGEVGRLRAKMLDRRMARAFRGMTEWLPG